jgi:dipeptidyl aminopeptidase/acylaminoacyl peptidase
VKTVQRDIRETALYREATALYTALRQPGTGQISDAADLHVCADGKFAVFTGTIMDKLEGLPPTRICQIDLMSGETRVLTFGPSTDRLPKYSPDGRQVAFLSDRQKSGDYQLYLLDPETGASRPTLPVPGWVEYLHWAPDGSRILIGVAGHGADISGGQGAVTSKQAADDLSSWMPAVESGDESYRWRTAWVYELATDNVYQVSRAISNVWESVWCGNETLAAVASHGPGEGLWYSARLHLIALKTGDTYQVYAPRDQLGWPAASPSGEFLAIVEAVCSDRWFVAGQLHLIEPTSGRVQPVDTLGVDITYTEWRSDRQLLVAGHRGFETVVGLCDAASRTFVEIWSSRELTATGPSAKVSGISASGDCALIGESFSRGLEIAVIDNGAYRAVKSLDLGYTNQAGVIDEVERIIWNAPDGLEIQGWLLKPRGKAPHPLIMDIHGGPVWQWRPLRVGASLLMLLKRGYAVFLPNPRGSSGRGQGFARQIIGEMGGAETRDLLSGLDYLVETGVADPARLGVIGGSHGGFMTSWLITQDSRFAAAVAIAPVTNQVSQQLIGNIPHFVSMFVADQYNNPTGKYFDRSPIMHAHKAKTPTLNICGALDRCTPPVEAMQFHNALLENRVESVLVTYPEEGHGVRTFPTVIDYVARVVSWFQTHMPARLQASDCNRAAEGVSSTSVFD